MLKNPKYDECQRGLTSMVYKFFDKKSPCLQGQTLPTQVMRDKSASGGVVLKIKICQMKN